MRLLFLYYTIIITLLGGACACTKDNGYNNIADNKKAIVFVALKNIDYYTRAQAEDLISNMNIFVVNNDTHIEQHIFINNRNIVFKDNKAGFNLQILKNVNYKIYICANLGYKLNNIKSIDDIKTIRYPLAYADEFKEGLPMSGVFEGKIDDKTKEVDVELTRLTAKISVCIDRTKLSDGVKMRVKSIEIKQCPKSVFLFQKSSALNEIDAFGNGYSLDSFNTDKLNIEEKDGVSRTADLYMLENMQGDFLQDIKTEKDKIIPKTNPKFKVCSYLEIKFDYFSNSVNSSPGKYLVYRLYLGENLKNFDIERNCNYKFIIQPKGTGLEETSWRVEKSGLGSRAYSDITITPSNYIQAKVGESVHIRAVPKIEGAFVDIGLEELEYDKERGIYDYTIDSDNKGVVLHIKGRGSGIVYITSGDYAAMALIITY